MSEDPGESSVIATIFRHQQTSLRAPRCAPPIVGAGDDAAWVSGDLVVTTDMMVEGVHFDDRLGPADVGWKLAAVNASDVGAMGCHPTWAVLDLSLPRPLDMSWVEAFSTGLAEGLAFFGVRLVGGDTTRSPGPVVAAMTMAGQGQRPVTRGGGRPGDTVWVTGTLGDAAAGFFFGEESPEGLCWLQRPRPPVEFGAALGASGLVTAMMDLSDGLAADLPRLCAASGTGARIAPEALPVGPALRGRADPVPLQVGFGEDYQLLFTTAPGLQDAVNALSLAHGVRVTQVGALTAARDVALSGRAWPAALFSHFGAEA